MVHDVLVHRDPAEGRGHHDLFVIRELWNHSNKIVFGGASPSTATVIARIEADGRAWT